MSKYFISACILSILCLLQVPTTNALTCYVTDEVSQMSNKTGCNYCGYMEIEHSATTQNGIIRRCLDSDLLVYSDGKNNQTYTALNICTETKTNQQTNKNLICDKDFCNEKCENGALSLSFSFVGIILSILIPLKLA